MTRCQMRTPSGAVKVGTLMRISLESLDGRHFVMELPLDQSPDRQHVISIHNAANLRGIYRQDDNVIALEGAKVDELVAEVIWHLASGPLKLAGPLTGGGIALDLVIPRGENTASPSGRASCASLVVPALSVTAGDASAPVHVTGRIAAREFSAANPAEPNAWHILTTELDCAKLSVTKTGLEVTLDRLLGDRINADVGGGATSARVTSASISNLSLQLPAFGIRVAQAKLQDLRVVNDASGLTLEVGQAEFSGVTVRIGAGEGEQHVRTSGAIRVRGFRFAQGSVTCARLEVEDATISALLAGKETEAVAPERAQNEEGAAEKPFVMPDLGFLDALHGLVNADLTVDIKLPFISRRVATHKLRLDVRQGTIDFKKLEDGLSLLEDALLDFHVRKNALVIEVKGVKKTLVAWPLDAEGLALAEKDRVKLRTLAQPDLPKDTAPKEPAPPPSTSGKDKSVGLSRLDVNGIEVQLGMSGGRTLALPQVKVRLGNSEAPALEQLTLQGSLSYAPDEAPSRTEPKTLRASLRGLHVGLEKLQAGAATVSVGVLALQELRDVNVTMVGLKPTKLEGAARGLVLESVEYRNPTG